MQFIQQKIIFKVLKNKLRIHNTTINLIKAFNKENITNVLTYN